MHLPEDFDEVIIKKLEYYNTQSKGGVGYNGGVIKRKMLNLSLLPLVLIGVLIGCGGDKNPKSTPEDGNVTGTPEAQGGDNREAALAEYLPGKRFEYGMSDQMKEVAAKAQNTRCMYTMRSLKQAIELWSLENKKQDAAEVTHEDLAPFMGEPATCPAEGKYILTTVGEGPKCSHGHSLAYKRGDKLPPFGGPPMRGVLQFNKDDTVLMGEFNEAGEAERRSPAMTYKVTGPMEISLGQTGTDGGKMIFTSINPAKGDAFTFLVLLGQEEKEVFSKAPITEVVPVSPLKEPEVPKATGEEPREEEID